MTESQKESFKQGFKEGFLYGSAIGFGCFCIYLILKYGECCP
jgi:hypothetical protein